VHFTKELNRTLAESNNRLLGIVGAAVDLKQMLDPSEKLAVDLGDTTGGSARA
jgi:hypothetical protein